MISQRSFDQVGLDRQLSGFQATVVKLLLRIGLGTPVFRSQAADAPAGRHAAADQQGGYR
jgi:hypothetical protein